MVYIEEIGMDIKRIFITGLMVTVRTWIIDVSSAH